MTLRTESLRDVSERKDVSAPFVEIERYYSTTSQIRVGRVSWEERGKESDFHPLAISPSRHKTIPMKRKRRSARPRIVLHLSLQGSIINGRDLPLHGSSGERNPRRTSLLAKRSKPVKISRLTRARVGRKKKIEFIDPNILRSFLVRHPVSSVTTYVCLALRG